jgi:hypothetical protein
MCAGVGARQAWEGTYDPYSGQTTQRLTFVVVAHNVTRAADCRCAAAAPSIKGCDDTYFRWANVSVRGGLAPSSVCQVIPGTSPAATLALPLRVHSVFRFSFHPAAVLPAYPDPARARSAWP